MIVPLIEMSLLPLLVLSYWVMLRRNLDMRPVLAPVRATPARRGAGMRRD